MKPTLHQKASTLKGGIASNSPLLQKKRNNFASAASTQSSNSSNNANPMNNSSSNHNYLNRSRSNSQDHRGSGANRGSRNPDRSRSFSYNAHGDKEQYRKERSKSFSYAHNGALTAAREIRRGSPLHRNNRNHLLHHTSSPIAALASPDFYSFPARHHNLILGENNMFTAGEHSVDQSYFRTLQDVDWAGARQGGEQTPPPFEQTSYEVKPLLAEGSTYSGPSYNAATNSLSPSSITNSSKFLHGHVSFQTVFDLYLSSSGTDTLAMAEALCFHPEAPPPAVLLYTILLFYRIPEPQLILTALQSIVLYSHRGKDSRVMLNYNNLPSSSSSSNTHRQQAALADYKMQVRESISSKEALEKLTVLLKEKVPYMFTNYNETNKKIQSLLLESLVEYECLDLVCSLLKEATTNAAGATSGSGMNDNDPKTLQGNQIAQNTSMFSLQNVNSSVWSKLIIKATRSKLPNSELLFLLLQMDPNLADLNSSRGTRLDGASSKNTVLFESGQSPYFATSLNDGLTKPRKAPETFFEVRPADIIADTRVRQGFTVNDRNTLIPLENDGNGSTNNKTLFGEYIWRRLKPAELTYLAVHPSAAGSDPLRAVHVEDFSLATNIGEGGSAAAQEEGLDGDKKPLLDNSDRDEQSANRIHFSVAVNYALTAEMAANLLLKCGLSFERQSSPLLALQIMKRYVKYCEVVEEERDRLRRQLALEQEDLLAWEKQDNVQQLSLSSFVTPEDVKAGIEEARKSVEIERVRRQTSLQILTEKLKSSEELSVMHPTPFLLFFKIFSEAKEYMSAYNPLDETSTSASPSSSVDGVSPASPSETVLTPLPVLHWEIAWYYFKLLNRKNQKWYYASYLTPEEAKDLSLYVLQIMTRGADPWLTLNVARNIARRHIIDGVEVSLWFLHHVDISHHPDETRRVLRLLFHWLLKDVGVHLHPHLHHHLIPAARVLIKLNMHTELILFYNIVIDNVFYFSENFRNQFMRVMGDLVCPVCQSILDSNNIYVDRNCSNCMAVVAAQPPDHIPSFQLSVDHAQHLREKRKQRRDESRQRLRSNVRRLHDGSSNQAGAERKTPKKPMAAVSLFQKHVLSDAPLLPGVTVVPEDDDAAGVSLLPSVTRDGGKTDMDVPAMYREATRRLELHRYSRRAALLERGVSPELIDAEEAKLNAAANGGDKHQQSHAQGYQRAYTPTGLVAYTNTEGSWTCLWCHGNNSEWSSRLQCGSCGAQTGPCAPWREFKYANKSSTSGGADVMEEIRARIANSATQPVDAVVAGYLLMLYKKAFKLRGVPHDYERLSALIERLCLLHERVLAGYLYVHLVPLSRRDNKDPVLRLISELFQTEVSDESVDGDSAFNTLTNEELQNPEKEDVFFEKVFSKRTCKVCFGQHAMKDCPLITRDFSSQEAERHKTGAASSMINLSPEEKQKFIFNHLKNKIDLAIQHHQSAGEEGAAANSGNQSTIKYVVDAYAAFVTSPFREPFASHCPAETNRLSILLSQCRQFRRAAFVLCHLPIELRWNEAYLKLVPYFSVTESEAMVLLGKRQFIDQQKSNQPQLSAEEEKAAMRSHPYFTQVTLTCCMCLDGRHAAAQCPRLYRWLAESEGVVGSSPQSRTHHLSNPELLRRLLAQVDGWVTAGPERLFSFYGFLLEQTHKLHSGNGFLASEDLRRKDDGGAEQQNGGHNRRRVEVNRDPLVYALNKVIVKLAQQQRLEEAYRLYIHVPVYHIQEHTTTLLLRTNHFTDEGIQALLAASAEYATGANVRGDGSQEIQQTVAGGASKLQRQDTDYKTAMHEAAVPLRYRCLLCCAQGHDFYHCPELNGQPTMIEKMLHVMKHVGSITIGSTGVNAAANYIYHLYNKGQFPSNEALRDLYSPATRKDGNVGSELVLNHNGLFVYNLLQLVKRCWATRQLYQGMRLLRRVPVEYMPVEPFYTDLWRAAGQSEDVVEGKLLKLSSLLHVERINPAQPPYYSADLRPNQASNPAAKNGKENYSSHFLSQYSAIVFDGLCRHCLESSHQLSSCPTFHEEVSFGRDLVAAYRMSIMSEQLTGDFQHCYLLLLILFISRHMPLIPYHIAGVTNATNALAAMMSFKGEIGVALYEELQNVYPQYRRRQVFKHILHVLQVPPQTVQSLLNNFYFAPDPNTTSSSGKQSSEANHGSAVVAQHLLVPKPAIRDVAVKQIFSQYPMAMTALAEALQRMHTVLKSNLANRTPTNNNNVKEMMAMAQDIRQAGRATNSDMSTRKMEEHQKSINATFQQILSDYVSHLEGQIGEADIHHNSAAKSRTNTGGKAQANRTTAALVQGGDISTVREGFEPLLALLEDCVGMRLGSRHVLFSSAVDILSPSSPNLTSSHTTVGKDGNRTERVEGKVIYANSAEEVDPEKERSAERQHQQVAAKTDASEENVKRDHDSNYIEHVVEAVEVNDRNNKMNAKNHNSGAHSNRNRSSSSRKDRDTQGSNRDPTNNNNKNNNKNRSNSNTGDNTRNHNNEYRNKNTDGKSRNKKNARRNNSNHNGNRNNSNNRRRTDPTIYYT